MNNLLFSLIFIMNSVQSTIDIHEIETCLLCNLLSSGESAAHFL